MSISTSATSSEATASTSSPTATPAQPTAVASASSNEPAQRPVGQRPPARPVPRSEDLAAQIEPFDSFWEGPSDVEKGYGKFLAFYRDNYLQHMPSNKDASILIVSCGPGYMINLLKEEGYTNVLGIDSYAEKIEQAKAHELNCRTARAFEFLSDCRAEYDAIFCEQEINHLTKEEIPVWLDLMTQALKPGGRVVMHALNGANPITGAEALAQNYDHYNTFTEYTMEQVLDFYGYKNIEVFGLNLYVFKGNPANYVAMAAAKLYSIMFRASFILYGKNNKIFTKKIGAVAYRG